MATRRKSAKRPKAKRAPARKRTMTMRKGGSCCSC